MSNTSSNLVDLPLDQLEAEIRRRRHEQYPAEVDALVRSIKERAAFHKMKPRQVLEDCGRKLATKKFVALSSDDASRD